MEDRAGSRRCVFGAVAALFAARDGSWPPVGVWSYCGGRVFSTALLALALEAPTRLTLPEEEPKERKKKK